MELIQAYPISFSTLFADSLDRTYRLIFNAA